MSSILSVFYKSLSQQGLRMRPEVINAEFDIESCLPTIDWQCICTRCGGECVKIEINADRLLLQCHTCYFHVILTKTFDRKFRWHKRLWRRTKKLLRFGKIK